MLSDKYCEINSVYRELIPTPNPSKSKIEVNSSQGRFLFLFLPSSQAKRIKVIDLSFLPFNRFSSIHSFTNP